MTVSRRLKALPAIAVAALIAGVLAAPPASAAAPPPNGLSEATAAASCWEIKQNTPNAPSGIYWLWTPALGAPERFYCDQTTSGGGWVLIGRGREDWSQSNEGVGTVAEVRDVITGTAAFKPRQLSSKVIEGLLNNQAVSALTDGIRLRRATNATGTTWQEATFKITSPRTGWSWMFDNEQRVGSWNIGGVTGSGGQTSGFGSGSNYNRVDVYTSGSHGWMYGWGFGNSLRGTPDANTYVWAYTTSAPAPRPFTQVFLRPRLLSSQIFTAIPDSGTPAITGTTLASSFALPTVWGVNGLGAGPSTLEGSNEVSAFAESNGIVYVGGNFTNVRRTSGGSGQVNQAYIAAFNVNTGELITTFRPTFNNQVKAIAALPDGRIAVGGYFTQVNGAARAGLVVLNPTTGATDTVFTGRLLNYIGGGTPVVRGLDVQGGFLYAGGSFTHATGGSQSQELYARSAARFSVTNGTPDGSWNPDFNATVVGIDASAQGDRVYTAGFFTASKGTFVDKAAAVRSSDAGLLGLNILFSNRDGTRTGYQWAIREIGNKIWVGGSEHMLFSYDRNTFANIDSNITKSGGDVQAIGNNGNIVYSGCHCFHTVYEEALKWGNVGTIWTQASKINSVGAWDNTTGKNLSNFSPFLSSRNGAGLWAVYTDTRGNTWTGGDYTASVRSDWVKQWSGGFARFPQGDAVAPTTPGSASAGAVTGGVRIAWNPSTDNVGVTGYEILRDDRVIATTTSTSIVIPTANTGTKYFVRAVDAGKNRSASTSAITAGSGPAPQDPVAIAFGSSWKYSYPTTAPASNWNQLGFNDASWATGASPLGWGHSGLGTTIDAPAPKPLTSYYRKEFQVTNAAQVASITVRTRADDGIVLYLNGTEVGRANIDPGTVTNGTYANAAVNASTAAGNPVTFTIPGNLVVTGTNVLTAEVHSNYRTTPSHSFDLQATITAGAQPLVAVPDPQPEPEPQPEPGAAFVAAGSTWSYRYEADAPPSNWRDVTFDDSSWVTGAALFGWGGDPAIATQLTTSVSPKPSSVYFRTGFTIGAGAVPAGGATITTHADDGIIVFVNGVEVGRSNLVAGTITHTTYANSAPSTTTARANPVTFTVPASVLVEGTNVIAVQVVSNYRSSPTLSFELTATAAG
jgi:hypothetical protein